MPTRNSSSSGRRVDLLLGVRQEARAVERPLAHEHRRDHRLEAVVAELLQRPPHERELDAHELPEQVREARRPTAGHRGPCRSSRPPAPGGRAPRSRARHLAHLSHELILGPVRGASRRAGWAAARAPPAAPARPPPARRSSSLARAATSCIACDLSLALSLLASRADARVGFVLLRPQTLQLGQQLPSALVQPDHPLEPSHRVLAATRQARPARPRGPG